MQALRVRPELEDLLGKGAKAAEPQMPFFEARTSIQAEQFDGMGLPEIQAHMQRARAYDYAAAVLRGGAGGFSTVGLGPGYSPNDPSHGPRTEAYDNSVLAEALRNEPVSYTHLTLPTKRIV